MPTLLSIRDESLGGTSSREWTLELLEERTTVQELIRSRVYQEVQDYNLRQGEVFHGLVQPEASEQSLNGWKMREHRVIDWKRQYELALDAFEQNRVLLLINDRQAESLDEEFVVGPSTQVTFLRLALLVGG